MTKKLLSALAIVLLGWAVGPATGAEIYGGIELGAKGVKAVALEVTAKPEGIEVKLLYSDSSNVGLSTLDAEGKLDPKLVDAAVKVVGGYVESMKTKHKLEDTRLAVVGSSGLFATNNGKAELIRENQEKLAAAVKKATGITVVYLDADREVALSIAGTLPAKHAADGLLIDIGGGNTKGGYRTEKGYSTFAVPLGTSTFAAAVKKQGGDFAVEAAKLRESDLAPKLKKALATDGGFAKKKHIYLSGGATWATATLVRPADRSAFTPLTAADFDAAEKMLIKSETVPQPDLTGIGDASIRKDAEKEFEQLKKVYTRDQLLAGVQILKALALELELGDKSVAFARGGQYAWIIGCVTEKVGSDK